MAAGSPTLYKGDEDWSFNLKKIGGTFFTQKSKKGEVIMRE